MLWLMLSSASAGDGPWAIGPGTTNVYVGLDYFRYNRLRTMVIDDDESTPDVVEVNHVLPPTRVPISAGAVSGVVTLGLRKHLEGELKVGMEWARITDPDNPLTACVRDPRDRPSDWCTPTVGLGDVYGALKYQFLDEYGKAPFSSAISLKLRSGEGHAHFRDRLTNIGDGTTDLGAMLSVGREGLVGSRTLRFHMAGAYFYRFANDYDYGAFDSTGDGEDDAFRVRQKYPRDELWGSAQLTLSVNNSFDIGPEIVGFYRLRSRTERNAVSTIETFLDPNAWNRLDATQVKVGVKANIYSLSKRTVSIGVGQTIYAVNNPANTFLVSVGVGQLVEPKRAKPPQVTASDEPTTL